jgi:GntR family transcriptional repressor for pyruvate dehydrogenase complex
MAHHGARAAPGLLHQQLDSPTRVDEITDRLITAIAIGEYLPGARLPVERELAASLGAGRMTVRAALARLLERRLIETRRGRGGGSYVLNQWPESSTEAVGRTLRARLDDLRDRCDAICRLQGTVCRAAAESRSAHDVSVMRAMFDAYQSSES